MSRELVLLVHAGATLTMVGLIWFVQVVHYPLFARVPGGGFATYALEHQHRTGRVVVPLMLAEAATAGALLWLALRRGETPGLAITGALLLAVIWLSTALLQVPLHQRLALGFDAEAAARLVTGNWIRTLAWSARGLVALALLRAG